MRDLGGAAAALLAAVLITTSCTTTAPAKGVALVASPKGSASATRVWAFSDAKLVQPASTYAEFLASERSLLCQTAEVGSQAVTLDQALGRLQHVLDTAAPGALDRLAKTKAGTDAKQAEAVAVAEIGRGNPGGALAALVIAHRDQPQEALHLENAAVIAVSIGYPQEALALLGAAEELPATLDPGMGVDRTATMQNNRAYALIRLGRYADAVALLRSAIAREPLLDEAQRNLAVALACLGQMSDAGAAYRAGLRRNRLQDLGDPSRAQGYDPSQVFDLSRGQPVKLPDVTYPQSLDAAAGSADKFQADWANRQAEAKQLLDQTFAIPSQQPGHAPLTTDRISRILGLVGDERSTALVAQLFERWQASYHAAADALPQWTDASANESQVCSAPGTDFTKCYETWCTSALPEAHTHWLTAIRQSDADLRAWAAEYSRVATGLAANLKDAAAHQWSLIDAQYWLISNYALQIQLASTWADAVASYKGQCFDQVKDAPAETKNGGKASAPGCSEALGGINISIDFEVFALSISCEEISFEAEVPDAEGGIAEAGEFVSVSHKFGGSTTVFAGGYAKTQEIAGLSAGAKGGAYVTWDGQGNVVDVGVRAEGSIDQSKPGAEGGSSEGGSSSGPKPGSSLAGKDVSWSLVGSADPGEG